MLVAGLLVVALLAPRRDRLAVVDDDLEERVHQQDAFGVDRRRVQQHRHRSLETVAVQYRLQKNEKKTTINITSPSSFTILNVSASLLIEIRDRRKEKRD